MDLDLSNTIRLLREEKRLTQNDIAVKLQTERSNYARLEKRGLDITVRQLFEIADALQVSVYDLFGSEAPHLGENEKMKELEKRNEELENIISNQGKLISEFEKNLSEVTNLLRWAVKYEFITGLEESNAIISDTNSIKLNTDRENALYIMKLALLKNTIIINNFIFIYMNNESSINIKKLMVVLDNVLDEILLDLNDEFVMVKLDLKLAKKTQNELVKSL